MQALRMLFQILFDNFDPFTCCCVLGQTLLVDDGGVVKNTRYIPRTITLGIIDTAFTINEKLLTRHKLFFTQRGATEQQNKQNSKNGSFQHGSPLSWIECREFIMGVMNRQTGGHNDRAISATTSVRHGEDQLRRLPLSFLTVCKDAARDNDFKAGIVETYKDVSK